MARNVGNGNLNTGLITRMKEIVPTEYKVIYILWKYYPEYYKGEGLKTFDDLKSRYAMFTDTITEELAERWEVEDSVQQAIKYLLKKLHSKKMIQIYNTFYEKAMSGDVQSAKFIMDFSKDFFADESESELTTMLNDIDFEN